MKCPRGYGFSDYCNLEDGHDGPHHNHRRTWTDHEAEQSRRDIIQRMKGRTE